MDMKAFLTYSLVLGTVGLSVPLSAQEGPSVKKTYVFRSERPVVRFAYQYAAKMGLQEMGTEESSSVDMPANPVHSSAGNKGKLSYLLPYSVLFKYDTTSRNPEHRCYEIRKPISNQVNFLFNFMSLQQYRINAL